MKPIPLQHQPRIKLKLPKFNQQQMHEESPSEPNSWFACRFPESAQKFGSAFLVGVYDDVNGLPRTIPHELNSDFFASALGGDKRMGHRVVYLPSEDAWWFLDPTIGAFCSTTEGKLEALMSNLIIRCAEDCSSLVDIEPLMTDFRKPRILSTVITRAKALLAADQWFFQGEEGHTRMVDGKIIEPNEQPTYLQFVQKGIVKEPEAKLTVSDAFHRYYQFCKDNGQKPLTRSEFKALVAEVIREEFRIGLRHDIVDESGKQQHGWVGIDCRLRSLESVGRN